MKIKLKYKKGAFRELRQQPKVRRDLVRRAELIAERASKGGQVDGYVVTDLLREDPRGAASVMATGAARMHNRKHHTLIRSIDAGR